MNYARKGHVFPPCDPVFCCFCHFLHHDKVLISARNGADYIAICTCLRWGRMPLQGGRGAFHAGNVPRPHSRDAPWCVRIATFHRLSGRTKVRPYHTNYNHWHREAGDITQKNEGSAEIKPCASLFYHAMMPALLGYLREGNGHGVVNISVLRVLLEGNCCCGGVHKPRRGGVILKGQHLAIHTVYQANPQGLAIA